MILREPVTQAALVLSFPCIALTVAVVYIWGTPALKAYRETCKGHVEWFVLGVIVSFTASTCYNMYWLLLYTTDYVGYNEPSKLLYYALYGTMPLKQATTSVAAYCHIRSYVCYADTQKARRQLANLHKLVLVCTALGVAYVSVVHLLKMYTQTQ